MKKAYIKPDIETIAINSDNPFLDNSQGNDSATNDSSQGEDNDGDGIWGPGDVDAKGQYGWDDSFWESDEK